MDPMGNQKHLKIDSVGRCFFFDDLSDRILTYISHRIGSWKKGGFFFNMWCFGLKITVLHLKHLAFWPSLLTLHVAAALG